MFAVFEQPNKQHSFAESSSNVAVYWESASAVDSIDLSVSVERLVAESNVPVVHSC